MNRRNKRPTAARTAGYERFRCVCSHETPCASQPFAGGPAVSSRLGGSPQGARGGRERPRKAGFAAGERPPGGGSAARGRDDLLEGVDPVHDDADVAVISRRDGADAVVMSLDHYQSIMETLHLLATPANASHLARSMAEH